MKNLYSVDEAAKCQSDLDFRVYTSNLLGQSDALVLHGGGNTSVKTVIDGEDILLVKGSGWDLVSIKAEGFAPVKMSTLLEMATLKELSDTDMVSGQKAAMIDAQAPNPSVEAILHALIPFKVVDHTHADAVVTISNSKNGKALIEELYKDFLIVPYVMPGFILAHTIYEMTRDFDWTKCKGIVLHNHGIFTFDDDAKVSYDKMIDAVSMAEAFLAKNAPLQINKNNPRIDFDTEYLASLISKEKGCEVYTNVNTSLLARCYSTKEKLSIFASRGVLTPEHVLRTKRVPLILETQDVQSALKKYIKNYKAYFDKYATDEIMLNPAPNYAVIKDFGVISFGKSEKEANIINDVVEHTMMAVLRADVLGGYQSISEVDTFEMEYWELEQNKLKATQA